MTQQYSYTNGSSERRVGTTGNQIPFIRDLIAVFRYMADPEVRWLNKGLLLAALAYLIIPTDAIPDMVPFIGWLDDLGVILLVFRYLRRQLMPYYR